MRAFFWVRSVSALIAVVLLWSAAARLAADDAALLLSVPTDPVGEKPRPVPQNHLTGRELFEREWQVDDPHSGSGDGLGPTFNAKSCAVCHHQQRVGGSGDSSHNVHLLTLVDARRFSSTTRTSVEQLHAGFKTANRVTLHTAGTTPGYEAYHAALQGYGPSTIQPPGERDQVQPIKVQRVTYRGQQAIEWDQFVLQQSQRNTPSLLGAGLIDKISVQTMWELRFATPLGKKQFSIERRRQLLKSVVACPDVFGESIQRFGWKGQSPTLKAFVVDACANELGLQSKGNPQPVNPVYPGYRSERVDMTQKQLDALFDFVASLPAPRRLEPKNATEGAALAHGALLFGQLRCQTCHVPDVENVQGLYSDLQLHDMGESLADPTGPAQKASVPTSQTFGLVTVCEAQSLTQVVAATGAAQNAAGATSLPRSVVEKAAALKDPDHVLGVARNTQPSYSPVEDLAAMWRTPPLWGVRDSAPYLHDGRAATLQQAIELHDGEAASSAALFRQLSEKEHRDLTAFVHSLGAP